METWKYLLLVLLWLVFAFTHSFLATANVKHFFREKLRGNFKYYRLAYTVLAGTLLSFILLYHFSINDDPLWNVSFLQQAVAGLCCISGLIIMLYCIKKYFFEMSGIDVFFKTVPGDKLQTNGLNRYVRHPLYSGTLLFVAGCLLWHPGLANLVSFLCVTVYTLVGIKYEEKKLLKLFGDDYKNYASQVPMIVPGFSGRKK